MDTQGSLGYRIAPAGASFALAAMSFFGTAGALTSYLYLREEDPLGLWLGVGSAAVAGLLWSGLMAKRPTGGLEEDFLRPARWLGFAAGLFATLVIHALFMIRVGRWEPVSLVYGLLCGLVGGLLLGDMAGCLAHDGDRRSRPGGEDYPTPPSPRRWPIFVFHATTLALILTVGGFFGGLLGNLGAPPGADGATWGVRLGLASGALAWLLWAGSLTFETRGLLIRHGQADDHWIALATWRGVLAGWLFAAAVCVGFGAVFRTVPPPADLVLQFCFAGIVGFLFGRLAALPGCAVVNYAYRRG